MSKLTDKTEAALQIWSTTAEAEAAGLRSELRSILTEVSDLEKTLAEREKQVRLAIELEKFQAHRIAQLEAALRAIGVKT